MTKAPKNWRNKGYLIPETINPEDNICICVPIPKDWGHARAFLGQLTELSKWQAWQADGTTNATDSARRWFDIVQCVAEAIDCEMANNGCGCGGTANLIYRHNPDTDRLEQSSDDGETWTNAPDPRYDSPLFQPQVGETPDDVKCLSATNAVVYFKDELIGQASEWTTLTTVIAGILTVVIGLLTGGLGAALVIDLAAAFIGSGIGAAIAAFTTEVYDRFKCNLYCHALDDGSWDESALAAIKAQINVDETGVANTILNGWIDQLGTAGLTNSGRLTLENDADCTGCDCTGCVINIDFSGVDDSPYTIIDGTIGAGHFTGDDLNGVEITGDIYQLALDIDADPDCVYTTFSIDVWATNSRPIHDVGLGWTMYDIDDVELFSAGGSSVSGIAVGTPYVFTSSIPSVTGCTHIHVYLNWGGFSTFGGSADIDNIHAE